MSLNLLPHTFQSPGTFYGTVDLVDDDTEDSGTATTTIDISTPNACAVVFSFVVPSRHLLADFNSHTWSRDAVLVGPAARATPAAAKVFAPVLGRTGKSSPPHARWTVRGTYTSPLSI